MKTAEKDLIPTPGEIWKILKETNRLLQKSKEETDRRIQESKLEMARKIQENDRLLQKSKEETDRKIQENDRLLRESKLENDRRKQETDRRIQESRLESDRRIQESKLENDRLLQKMQKKLEKMIEENKQYTQKIDSRWGTQWGKLMEALMKGSLLKILNQKGIKVRKVTPNYEGQWGDLEREYDLVAIDSQEMVVVETKSHLKKGHVDDVLKELTNFKKFCPEFKHLKVYGGVACLRSAKKVREYADSQGLFVFRVEGNDNAVLVNKPKFKAKIFC